MNLRPIRLGLLVVLSPVLAAHAAAPAAGAAPSLSGGISLSPADRGATLVFHSRPGAMVTTAVRVGNDSGGRKVVRLQPTDLATAAAGGMDFPDRRPISTGRWLRLAARDVSVPAHAERVVRLSARIPRGSTGDNYAGVIAVERDQLLRAGRRSGTRRVVIDKVVRIAVPLAVRIPGPRHRRLSALRAGFRSDATGTSASLLLHNTGNGKVRRTTFDLRLGRDGRDVARHRGTLADFYPRSGLRVAVPLPPGVAQRGSYRLVGTVRPAGAAVLRIDQMLSLGTSEARDRERTTGTRVPAGPGVPLWVWALIAGATLLAGALAVVCLRLRRRLNAR